MDSVFKTGLGYLAKPQTLKIVRLNTPLDKVFRGDLRPWP